MTHCLDGKTILGIEIASDRMAIRFLVAGGEPIVALADVGCSDNTWIDHVELPAFGFPAEVLAVYDLEMPEVDPFDDTNSGWDADGHNYSQFYGLKIATNKGDIVIDYRNVSNGYYGGKLAWPEDDHYGGVFGQNISTEEWQPVTEK